MYTFWTIQTTTTLLHNVKSNDTSFSSSEHKGFKYALKPNWSGANFMRGSWYRATYFEKHSVFIFNGLFCDPTIFLQHR